MWGRHSYSRKRAGIPCESLCEHPCCLAAGSWSLLVSSQLGLLFEWAVFVRRLGPSCQLEDPLPRLFYSADNLDYVNLKLSACRIR